MCINGELNNSRGLSPSAKVVNARDEIAEGQGFPLSSRSHNRAFPLFCVSLTVLQMSSVTHDDYNDPESWGPQWGVHPTGGSGESRRGQGGDFDALLAHPSNCLRTAAACSCRSATRKPSRGKSSACCTTTRARRPCARTPTGWAARWCGATRPDHATTFATRSLDAVLAVMEESTGEEVVLGPGVKARRRCPGSKVGLDPIAQDQLLT